MTDTCIECMILKDNKKNSSRDFYPKNLEIQIICGIQVNIILKIGRLFDNCKYKNFIRRIV